MSVIDRAGKRLKIPVWMLSPEASSIGISERIHLSKEALLSLASLLSLHAGENRGHDNLRSTAVNETRWEEGIGEAGGNPPARRSEAQSRPSDRRSGSGRSME